MSISFAHNARTSIVAIPAAVAMVAFGGQPFCAVLSGGVLIAYVAFCSHQPAGVLLIIVCTGVVAATVLLQTFFILVRHSWYNIMIVLTLLVDIVLLVVWITLQSRWLYLRLPCLAKTLEKGLFSYLPVTTAIVVRTNVPIIPCTDLVWI